MNSELNLNFSRFSILPHLGVLDEVKFIFIFAFLMIKSESGSMAKVPHNFLIRQSTAYFPLE